MSSNLAEIRALSPINQHDFKKAVNIYKNNLDDKPVSEACLKFFTTHLTKVFEKESKSLPRVSFYGGKAIPESFFSDNVLTLKKHNIDVVEMLKTHFTCTTFPLCLITNKVERLSAEDPLLR